MNRRVSNCSQGFPQFSRQVPTKAGKVDHCDDLVTRINLGFIEHSVHAEMHSLGTEDTAIQMLTEGSTASLNSK